MGYKGAWSRTVRVPDKSLPLGRPELSADHSADFEADGAKPPTPDVLEEYGPQSLYDSTSGFNSTSSENTGGPLDVSPTGHDVQTVRPSRGDQYGAIASSTQVHSQNSGSVEQQDFQLPTEIQAVETRETLMYTMDPVQDGSSVAVLRGLNSLPENNPDGFRVGQRVQRWVNRKIPRERQWANASHFQKLHLAALAKSSPPFEVGNQYTSPYDTQANAKVRQAYTPVMRREPRPWDDNDVQDGSTDFDPATEYDSWGL